MERKGHGNIRRSFLGDLFIGENSIWGNVDLFGKEGWRKEKKNQKNLTTPKRGSAVKDIGAKCEKKKS